MDRSWLIDAQAADVIAGASRSTTPFKGSYDRFLAEMRHLSLNVQVAAMVPCA